MFPEKKPVREKSNKCRIVVKKKADGSVVKSVEGECSKSQLQALSEVRED